MNRSARRLITAVIFLAGPIVGWFLNSDRGLLFGLVVSILAVIWLVIEERKLL